MPVVAFRSKQLLELLSLWAMGRERGVRDEKCELVNVSCAS